MPVELNDEEKAKFAEHLKELGYDDHAKKVIERLNGESKSQREAREKLESENKAYKEAEDKRKSDEDKRKAEDDKRKKAEDDEKKTWQERLDAIEKNFADKLTKSEQVATQKQAEFLDELKARDAEILMQAVRRAATKRGIIDEDLVSMIDVSKIPIERGKPSMDAISELIETHATAKPHLYREGGTQDRDRDENGRFTRPDPKDKPNGKVDASKLKPEEFDVLEQRLRSGKA